MRRKATWIIPGILVTLLLGLLGALPTLAAPSGAQGILTILDAPDGDEIGFVSPAGVSSFTIHVEDSDMNVVDADHAQTTFTSVGSADPEADCTAGGNLIVLTDDGTGSRLPIIDRNDDGVVNFLDVTTNNAETTIITVNGVDGVITLNCAVADLAMVQDDVTLTYDTTAVDTIATELTVDSATGAEFAVVLTETSINSGVFEATVALCTDPCVEDPDVEVDAEANENITIIYADPDDSTVTTVITSEPTSPEIPATEMAPNSGFATSDARPILSAHVTDDASGITTDDTDLASIGFQLGIYDIGAADTAPADGIVLIDRAGLRDETAISDGFDVEARHGAAAFDTTTLVDQLEYELRWWVTAMDVAGNLGVSDQDTDGTDLTGTVTFVPGITVTGVGTAFLTEIAAGDSITVLGETRLVLAVTTNTSLTVTAAFTVTAAADPAVQNGVCLPADFVAGATPAGCDPRVVRIDELDPPLDLAVAGNWVEDGDTLMSGSDAIRTSIQVIFGEAMDCDSFAVTDFEVDGDTPVAVNCFADFDDSAFLDVPEMAPDATPNVLVLKDSVTDAAGNLFAANDDVDAADGMPVTITATMTGTAASLPGTDDEITILLESNEQLAGRPTVEVRLVDSETVDGVFLGPDLGGPASTVVAHTEHRLVLDAADLSGAGIYNVFITGTDDGGGIDTTLGLDVADYVGPGFGVDDFPDSDALVFELDLGVPDPITTPADGGSVDDPNSFIKMEFIAEGREIGVDVDHVFTTVTADIPADDADHNFDEHHTVELIQVIIDGPGFAAEDVTDRFSSRDNILYLFRPLGLAEGTYTVSVTFQDEVGNEVDDFSFTFDVVERATYDVPLDPGANLISIPADPVNGDINAVFGGEAAITLVMTFDNESGLWLVATRDTDPESPTFGQFIGNLTSIDARHAYWVISDQQLDLPVLLPASVGGVPTLPPAIEVFRGWNLVPVVSLAQDDPGSVIDADVYFAGLDWSIAYCFDTVDGTFKKVTSLDGTPDDEDDPDALVVGRGYFVYLTEDGVIVP